MRRLSRRACYRHPLGGGVVAEGRDTVLFRVSRLRSLADNPVTRVRGFRRFRLVCRCRSGPGKFFQIQRSMVWISPCSNLAGRRSGE